MKNRVNKGFWSKIYDDQKVGIITNYFSEQILTRDFSTVNLPFEKCQEIIRQNEIEMVFIDSVIYELDHPWYDKSFQSLVDFLIKSEVNVIVIKNTSKEVPKVFNQCFLWNVDIEVNDISYSENCIKTPPYLNEFVFNPIEDKKNYDVLYFNFGQIHHDKRIKQFHEKLNPSIKECSANDITRDFIIKLISKIKETKILYIYYNEDMDATFLKYLEIAAALQNSIVVLEGQYQQLNSYAINYLEDYSNVAFMRGFHRSEIFSDKFIISNNRQAFLNNTLIRKPSLLKIFDGKSNNKEINISVITSSKRKSKLRKYIHRLNQQKYVNIEVILLTHGFVLSDEEKNMYCNLSNFKLSIIEEDKSVSLGNCLNKCLENAKYEYVTKVDDDDFYYPNYLIDSWIAQKYSQADIVGKAASFIYLQSENLVMLRHAGSQYKYVNRIIGGSIFCRTSFLKRYRFGDLTKGEDTDLMRRINEERALIYAGHPYEACIFRSSKKYFHTWKVTEIELLNSAIVFSYGDPEKLLTND